MKSLIAINILFIIQFAILLYLDIQIINYNKANNEQNEYNYNLILEEEFQND